MTHPALLVQDLSFSYDRTNILDQVSLCIQEGEFVGIFGPNGGGKTTFLRLLLGFLTPTQGSIHVLGHSPKQARTQMGYVPQNTKTDRQFPITAEEVVQMGSLSHVNWLGRLPRAHKEKALFYLEKVGMIDKRHTPFGKLSGGQAQRVLIARALLSETKLLLLDEPTASIDPQAEQEILSLLFSLKGTMTILMVTHDLQTILHTAEKLLCVHRTIHSLSPSQVCEHFGLGLYHSPLVNKTSTLL
ncbi:MAG: ABC transporter ATP-binding protein [Chlamydiae bacterium]|nr:ABC transporter ATP-binding protein [Chlamydiota bacterium]